jgi:hypothetical protein
VWRLLLLLVAVVVMIALRQPDKLTYPQFWAEDAAVFYLQAENDGLGSFGTPYGGYWHGVPRAVALLGTAVPIAFLPMLYTYTAVVLTALCLAVPLEGLTSERWRTRWALVLAVLLTPASGELWATLTNVQWIGASALVALLAAPTPASRQGRVALGVVAAVLGLTGPFATLLWPCAALRAWWRRDRFSVVLLAVLTACAALTGLALANHPRGDSLLRLSDRVLRIVQAAGNNPLAATAGAAAMAFLFWGMVIGVQRRDWPIVACATACVCITAGSLVTVPPEHFSSRYLFVPWSTGTWTAILLVSRGMRLAWAPVVAAALVAAVRFPAAPLTRYDWPRDARCLETHATCDMTINPSWKVGLPGRGKLAS